MSARGVLRLVTRLNIGGPAQQALMLTEMLRPQFRTMLAAGTPAPDEGEMSRPGVDVEHVPFVRNLDVGADLRALRAVRRLLAGFEPDIVHTHMAKAGTIGRVAVASSRRRARTVHTFHGHVLEGYFSPLAERTFLAVERLLASRTDALVTISPGLRDQLLELGIGTEEKFRVIPLGFDLSAFFAVSRPTGVLREAVGLAPDAPLLVSVGRLVPIKNHELLIGVVEQLPGVHCAIVGDGERRAALTAEVRARRLQDRVHFLGWRRDLPDLLADADVAVLTSANEGTPVSLIEASAAGVPVVATEVGGVSFVVRPGATGRLVPSGDGRAFADAVRALLADPALRRRLGQAGREHVRARFGSAELVGRIGSLYQELLA